MLSQAPKLKEKSLLLKLFGLPQYLMGTKDSQEQEPEEVQNLRCAVHPTGPYVAKRNWGV
jgi:hypothetical protein